jgi:hypothetical protein
MGIHLYRSWVNTSKVAVEVEGVVLTV